MINDRDMYYGGYMPMDNMGMLNSVPNTGMYNPNMLTQGMPNNYSVSFSSRHLASSAAQSRMGVRSSQTSVPIIII